MKIGGFQAQSTVDYPGCLAAVVFTVGCNLNCSYCHNRELIRDKGETPLITPEAMLALLKQRSRFLDGVVLSGGEPTLQPDLEWFLRRLREMGYRTKLDTNGTRPHVIERLIEQGLVDFVAMDVKASPSRYSEICGSPVELADVQASIALLMKGRVDYEFRTTLAPQLTAADLDVIRFMLAGARSHVLQKYRPVETVEEKIGNQVAASPEHLFDRASGLVPKDPAGAPDGLPRDGVLTLRGMDQPSRYRPAAEVHTSAT